jgi:RNA polymerase sigma-70 factor (ECF subfamily)
VKVHRSSTRQCSTHDADSPHGGDEPFGKAALELLFRDCAGDVHGYAISLLGDRAGAEDVTALAFERLYRSRTRLDRSRGTPRAWLFAIARNAALDELRGRRRHRLDVTAAESVDDHGQLTNGELARVLGISESNAGTRVHRALSTLRATCAGLDREEVA